MSLETWMSEFYPVGAQDATGHPLEAAQHSLQKWIGLRADNLERHDLKVDWGDIVDKVNGEEFLIDDSSCSLCVFAEGDCGKCPLYDVRGGHHCCEPRGGEDHGSPFSFYLKTGDPKPMIGWLEKTVEFCKAQAAPQEVSQ